VYGCSISSYSYKRQNVDKYQNTILVLAIFASCAIGTLLGESSTLILLGYVPWAICIGVLLSAFYHWVKRLSGTDKFTMLHWEEKMRIRDWEDI
jgi:hypothetical protein